jgi:hypothetical protein
MTLEALEAKRQRYAREERSRPALEMPGRSRVAKARAMANLWHNTIVKHMHNGKPRFGRVRFQGILKPYWFRIDWHNGSSSEHMGHIFRNLKRVDDADAPHDVPPPVDPVVIAAIQRSPTSSKSHIQASQWRLATVKELGLTHDDYTALRGILPMSTLQSMVSPILPKSADLRMLRDHVTDDMSRGKISCEYRAFKPFRESLHDLMEPLTAKLVLVPSSPELFLSIMPIATYYAKVAVCAKLTPELSNLLWQGKFEWLSWYLHHKETGNLLVHNVCDEDTGAVTTWLYIFPRKSRKLLLNVDLPDTCEYLQTDLKTGDIRCLF